MPKELIINQTLNECRAALLENGEIIDFVMDRSSDDNAGIPSLGNIYKGKVLRVLPGMQSAFVDIGYEKAAFLYVDDAYIPTLQEQRDMAKLIAQNGLEESARERLGEVIPDELSTLSETVNMGFCKDRPIETFLKEGQEIIVQVAKEPISTKGPRVTRHITLAGRHIVYMPFIEHTGVSRRIENEEERTRLKEIIETIRPEGKGVIARTVAEAQSYKTLKADYNMLVKIWKDILKRTEKTKAPIMIYKDLNFVQRVLRDITDEDLAKIIVDTKENLKEVDKFALKYMQTIKGKCELYDGETPIFEYFGIDLEIERALSNKVFLRSGGSINIDQTEALVSIDVNTGKYVGRKTLEDTILNTNLEAVKEIAYQLRLRNCGGIIIIDFIDMQKEENRVAVYNALLEALKKDRAKTNVLPISALGLVEMTRKRTRDTLTRLLTENCPHCEGTGKVKTILTVCYELIRELLKVLKKSKGSKVHIYAHPEVSARLCGEDLDIIENLEDAFGKSLIIRSENNYHVEQYEIFPQEY
ncbi:MAG: ribonuclease G [Bdellovibrionales bacterium RIFOXYD12_FULL_39_22]|nr:MAG: ribonuclease G [Bdellovibrionales bacterium RIFOXYB1_FULL_39_21]OFZ43391.1 MAG: ribonuclease G [Bdellovibrionales bacterium RIFOXYC12_FULL_39_17]OFZ47384.1 MAG: ribonuclease G [Bdellovibrionales bacterium RIFOXYC1_FULL_39_130]OFZ76264.1 MAG: ribonuclease G [Bdellovibrionales bacterium RIFOXYD1_FULL_39_84]OFZ94302.1 MAG: ribonuclease G [Bdellovibrionales bacterium RIFOXYD12_FULL_39_22]HLE12093.1 Rne/Rng family ribonuclease [Bacteriovoracaceae bacterium]